MGFVVIFFGLNLLVINRFLLYSFEGCWCLKVDGSFSVVTVLGYFLFLFILVTVWILQFGG